MALRHYTFGKKFHLDFELKLNIPLPVVKAVAVCTIVPLLLVLPSYATNSSFMYEGQSRSLKRKVELAEQIRTVDVRIKMFRRMHGNPETWSPDVLDMYESLLLKRNQYFSQYRNLADSDGELYAKYADNFVVETGPPAGKSF